MSGLTPKQARFVEEYLRDLNSTQAAIRAGYSKRNAGKIGPELLGKTRIATEIDVAKISRSERTSVDADWVIKRLVEEAEADVSDLYDEDTGDLKSLKEWPKIWRQGLVAGIDVEVLVVDGVERGRIKKIRLSDRTRRLELIGKHVKVNAFQDHVHHTGLEALGDRLERAVARDADADMS